MKRLVVLLPLGLVVAACGGSASRPIADAVEKTNAAGTERMEVVLKVDARGQKLRLRGGGSFDGTVPQGSQKLVFTVIGSGSTTFDEVWEGPVLWIRTPLFTAIVPPGKTWVKFDTSKAASASPFNFKQLLAQTPADVLTHLGRASAAVATVGREKVGGVQTTHYRAAYDKTKIPAGDKVQKQTDMTFKPLDVWIDKGGLVRRARLEYTAKVAPKDAHRAHVVLTMDMSKFGAAVTVNAPTEGQTVDATAKVGG